MEVTTKKPFKQMGYMKSPGFRISLVSEEDGKLALISKPTWWQRAFHALTGQYYGRQTDSPK